jgi:PPK2 family polyphosphate:nucleotide phosphotransferase
MSKSSSGSGNDSRRIPPVDSPYRAKPGQKHNLSKVRTDATGDFADKEDAAAATDRNLKQLAKLQELLYAEGKHAVLIVVQAMDTGGKDGAIEHVFSSVNPQGCTVTSFKQPTHLELRHDFLWRIHQAAPPKGLIGIFNRSHYESLLVERVHELVPKKVWSRRFDRINEFEKMLSDEGTTILKFFLHISKDEQKKRLQARLDDRKRHWKFDPNDLAERKKWDDYQEAYEDVLRKCSTNYAPWYIVPADHKWFRNWMLADTIVKALEALDMKYPAAPAGLDEIKIP